MRARVPAVTVVPLPVVPGPRRRRRPLRLVALLAAAALAAACSGSDGSAGAGGDAPATSEGSATAAGRDRVEPELVEDGDFYAVPDPLPEGDHGSLLRYRPTSTTVAGADAYTMMYLSESVAGDPIAVTGTVLVPTAPAPSGGRPVLTIAHGTSGIADECAPSKSGGSELGAMGRYVEAGYLVALTDYEGLGTPGRHPYLVGGSEGRGVLDAARAATQLPEAGAGDRLAIFGYSQGGHGALWAGQLADEWTPEFDLVGTVAGAPATEIPVIIAAAGSLPIAGFVYMIFAGYNAAYDEADLSTILTPAGEVEVDAVDQGCVGDVIRHFAGSPSSELIKPDPGSIEPWRTLAEENNPGNEATDAPILILHSLQDDVVPAALSEQLLDRMCRNGQVVERRTYDKGQDHGGAYPDAVADGFTWLQQRLHGDEPGTSCPSS
jgi:pimeloyl-ACP methyl ester carboxylesterase